MYAIYTGRLAHIVEDLGDSVQIEFQDGKTLIVEYGADTLVIDPTDDQVAAARDGRAIPVDPEFEAEVHADLVANLTRAAANPSLKPEARAQVEELLRQARQRA